MRLALMAIVFLFISCNSDPVFNNKDLEQNMMDLKLYQENLGDQLKNKHLQDASWLLEGMDSILLVVSDNFKKHRKLDRPFSYFYETKMKKPISEIRQAINDNDTAAALKGYKILVDHCNGCHIDHDVDKEVFY